MRARSASRSARSASSMRLAVVDPQHEDRAPRVELDREVERAAHVVERLAERAQDEGVAVAGRRRAAQCAVQRADLRRW